MVDAWAGGEAAAVQRCGPEGHLQPRGSTGAASDRAVAVVRRPSGSHSSPCSQGPPRRGGAAPHHGPGSGSRDGGLVSRHQHGGRAEHQDGLLPPKDPAAPRAGARWPPPLPAFLLDGGAKPEASLWPHVEADKEGRQNGRGRSGSTIPARQGRHRGPHQGVPSFRHSFKELARAARSGRRARCAHGHTGGGIGRKYGGFGLKVLAEELARIEAPAAVRGLRWD